MAIFIIPLAISVHTVVSWIFAMTLRPGWNSSIFGPYFVVGAIYSGTAGVIFSMYILRRVLQLGDYVQELHFRKLGLLLLAFSLTYLYFNINEYLTAGYKLEGAERVLLDRLFVGDYAMLFWAGQGLCVFIPAALLIAVLGFKRYHCYTIPGVVSSSALVIVGAWVKRYIIVVPTLRSPYLPSGQRLPWGWTHYHPTWVEWSITAAAVAAFALIYTLMVKVFPIVSIWETREQEQETAAPELPEAVPTRWWKLAEASLRDRLQHGGKSMPSFEYLRADEVEALFGYLEKLAGVPPTKRDGLLVPESAARVGSSGMMKIAGADVMPAYPYLKQEEAAAVYLVGYSGWSAAQRDVAADRVPAQR
ncbi:MAG: NrfD/PsrC family molybdoenzyme membrane anchor subunit [Candidatus Korobacteraceae bacterium]|jgi:hypothetical protein